ncbi:Gfo/Idh/MocA family oxidoreductase [Aminobacter sp. MSH1]|uniref:Gfo/Idh/MocA family protein n=1 Tax=Aminobacter sp. MSH1 TaxID=374606 RepID=UPI000D3478A8|nr:Gfo/Idh/MocA family oxidoreductase [Aminobacter sp. MSH1]
MKPIKVAVIGTGFFSQFHYDAWSRLPGVKIVGISFASNRVRAEEYAARYGVSNVYRDAEAMMDKELPDLVDIVSPPETHLDFVEQAVRRGILAITQKPLATSLAEAIRVVDVASCSTVPVVVHENWRFKPWFREIGNILASGRLGTLYSVAFRLRPGDGQGPSAYMDRQPYFQKMPRFMVHETGIHMVDVFRFLFGEVSSVSARLRKVNEAIAGEDAGYVVFDFKNGSTGMLDGNRCSDFPSENPRLTMGTMLVEGSAGQLWLEGSGRIFIRKFRGSTVEHEYKWEDRGYGGDTVYNLQRHVVDHIRNGTPLENTAENYLPNAIIEDAIYRSHHEKRVIDVSILAEKQAS